MELKIQSDDRHRFNSVTMVDPADLVRDDPTTSNAVHREMFDKLPLESQSSALSSLATLASPGVSAN